MGKKAKAGADKKKKGPKGKRARAKAKLERQWGEETKEEIGSHKRVGRSRLLSRLQGKNDVESDDSDNDAAVDALMPTEPDRSDSESDDDNDPDDDDMDLENGGAYSKLLQTIRNASKDGDPDSEEDSDVDEDAQASGKLLQNESDDDSDDEDDEAVEEEANFDPFGSRFSKEQLPEDDSTREKMLQNLQQTGKMRAPHVDPLLELHVSKPLLAEINLDGDKNMPRAAWKKLANLSFSCNRDILKRSWKESQKKTMSPWQSILYPFMTQYADCLVTCKSAKKREQLSRAALLHVLNHVLTSRGRIQRQNRRLKAKIDEDDMNDDQVEEQLVKDQGYTRPTVLVLLPTRGVCHKFLHQMLHLLGGGNVPDEYMERFDAEYGAKPTEQEGGPGDEDALRRRRKKVLQEKGAAWQELFGDEANSDDDFKIGVALNAKAAPAGKKKESSNDKEKAAGVTAKLYTDFYSSDIIVASPLGLRMALASDSDQADADFLSSIEICLLDRSDIMMMQNWDHVNEILGHLNQLPANNNETDFSRVREYFLVNQAAHWRQLILLTDILDPAILSTFKRFAKSHSGTLKMRQRVSEDEGGIANVIVPIRQVFQRIPVASIRTMNDDRIKYMVQKIMPKILKGLQKHTLIYIPSYFDFVAVRNHLLKEEAEFVSVTEYSRVSETSRGRARFHQGRKPLMLYTGRAHFFLRHKIKGIRHLIFFGLPEHSSFYADMVNAINDGLETDSVGNSSSDAATSTIALFTKYEAHSLERIVGTEQSNRMVKGEKSTFMFVS